MKKPPRSRSAITSGNRLFVDRIDLRSARGLRFQDLVDRYSHDCGGGRRISEATRTLIRRLAFLQCQLEDAELQYVKAGACSADDRLEYQRLSGLQSRLMKKIGLFDAKPNADPDDDDGLDPLTYAERGHLKSRSVKRERLNDDEEQD